MHAFSMVEMLIADIICDAESNGWNNRYQVEKFTNKYKHLRHTHITHTHIHPHTRRERKSVHRSMKIWLKSMFQLVIVIDIYINCKWTDIEARIHVHEDHDMSISISTNNWQQPYKRFI